MPLRASKIILFLGAVGLLIALFASPMRNELTLNALKESLTSLRQSVAQTPALAMLGFSFLYITFTALSVPGAVLLTLSAGALFGQLWGTIVVSFSSALGATAAFLVARWFLRESLTARFGARLEAINKGIEQDGAFYVFALRLTPIVPFFIITKKGTRTHRSLAVGGTISELAQAKTPFLISLLFKNYDSVCFVISL